MTIQRPGVLEALRKTLLPTHPIESTLPVVEDKCRRVKKRQGGDMKQRGRPGACCLRTNPSGG